MLKKKAKEAVIPGNHLDGRKLSINFLLLNWPLLLKDLFHERKFGFCCVLLMGYLKGKH